MADSNKRPLIIIAGPTAVGKSELGINLAKQINGEIISADSMQVYKYMDIGTAKIMPEEMDGIRHHLIDILDPTEPFHVHRFQELAKQAVEEIYSRDRIPIIVGGTGFYIQALLYDIDFSEEGEDSEYRSKLTEIANTKGNETLHQMLKEVDPETADAIHANNVQRVIRAIEFYYQTGEKLSAHNLIQRERTSPYNFRYFVLNDLREIIYERIDLRVDKMISMGLVDEVKSLINDYGCKPDMTSMQGIGYKQVINYLNGEYDYEEMVRLIKRDSRHFAKRQLTWFNREKDLIFIDKQSHFDIAKQLDFIKSNLGEL